MVEDRRFLTGFLGKPAGQGERGLEGDGLVLANAAPAKLLPRGACESFKASETLKQILRHRHGRRSADPGAQQDGEEFGVPEGVGTTVGEAFAGAIGLVEVEDAVVGWHGVLEESTTAGGASRV